MSSRRTPPLLVFLCCVSEAASLQPFEAVEPHMGTLFRIKLYAETEARAQAAFRSAFERVGALDDTLSDYKPESELNRLTVVAVGRPMHVSSDLFRVLQSGQMLASQTDGAFDVTLGPLTHLWRSARKAGRVPDVNALRDAQARCGFRKMHLNARDQTAQLDERAMQLDLGGIAKGYAADEAIATLRRVGISRALVAASGDLAFSDAPPGKSGWSIGIDSMDSAGQSFTKVLTLRNAAISTSGDTEQHLDSGGRRYSHIIEPQTGMGLTNRLTVSVVAAHGMEADALTKVVSIWGPHRGLEFIERRPGVKGLVVDRSVRPVVMSGRLVSEGCGRNR